MSDKRQQTIILGFDGIDAKLTAALMAAGRLPALKELARIGGFHHVLSTTPAESPVAWTSFNMSANPAQTNMFDFIGRLPGSYSPILAGSVPEIQVIGPSSKERWGIAAAAGGAAAAVAYGTGRTFSRRLWLKGTAALGAAAAVTGAVGFPWTRWWPQQVNALQSTIHGQPWWDRLGGAGQRCVALRIPMTFPARAHPSVQLLSGLGVPDMRGTNGTYLLLSDAPDAKEGKNTLPLRWEGQRCTLQLPGPDDPLHPGKQTFATLTIQRTGSQMLKIEADGPAQTITKDRWSDWIGLCFECSPLWKRYGLTRLYYSEIEGKTRLYLTPIEFDPARPPKNNPISSPSSFASDLQQRIGRFRTIGWETQTWGLVDGVLGKSAYLADVQGAMDLNEAQLQSLLQRNDWDHLMLVVQSTDQAQHMFFDDELVAMRSGAALDPDHPLLSVYDRMDRIIGQVQQWASQNNARLIVMSDHGFSPYRRAVHLNTWLAKRGWLALKDRNRWDSQSADDILAGEIWSNVDWFNSRAYALGLGGIYLNVAGREPGGIVRRGDEYEFLQDRLRSDLKNWADPQTGKAVFHEVYRRQDVYDGPFLDAAPDLIVGFKEGYRVSSASALGGMPKEEITDNTSHWNGDHCGIDASLIPGICFTNFANDWPKQIPIDQLAKHIWRL